MTAAELFVRNVAGDEVGLGSGGRDDRRAEWEQSALETDNNSQFRRKFLYR